MSEKQKITVVCPRELAEQIRRYQSRLSERTGANLSLSQTAASLLRKGLQEAR